MSDNNQKHPYHLVDPSPWPLVTSFSALIMAIGFIFSCTMVKLWYLP